MSIVDRRALKRLALYFLAWTGVGLFYFTQDATRNYLWHSPIPWRSTLISWLVGVNLSAAFTPAILWLGRRFPFERRVWLRRTLTHLALSVVFSLVHLTLDSAILSSLGIFSALMKPSFAATFFLLLILGFHPNVIAYWTVLCLQYVFHYYNQYQERRRQALRLELQASELRSQLVQAQLTALKGQLQPHFLFNTLNAIMVLVRQGRGTQAEEMLARLSDLLRNVLDDVEAQEVTLRRELDSLRLYLAIEEVRFQDRLRVEIDARPGVLAAAVPHLGLQPIVENAIRHGIGSRSAAGRLRIHAARVGELLEIRVEDDGPGLPPGGPSSKGIGLANTRARLRQLYGDAAALTLENGAQGGAVATLTLPYRARPDEATAEMMEIHALDPIDR
ncbi:MAG: sensor histidine kinase [Acidobacteria bacterium]|nr:MAG: sensor histidine kinase [Acidobacteriota bacterium]